MSSIRLAVRENILRDPSKVTMQMYRDYLDRDGCAWVCERGQKIVGFSYAAVADHSIWALFVDPEHEGFGAGKKLLSLACDWLFAQGAEQIQLSTSKNSRADYFYQAQGWQRIELTSSQDVKYLLRKNR